jgi:hypothetical protein
MRTRRHPSPLPPNPYRTAAGSPLPPDPAGSGYGSPLPADPGAATASSPPSGHKTGRRTAGPATPSGLTQ